MFLLVREAEHHPVIKRLTSERITSTPRPTSATAECRVRNAITRIAA